MLYTILVPFIQSAWNNCLQLLGIIWLNDLFFKSSYEGHTNAEQIMHLNKVS